MLPGTGVTETELRGTEQTETGQRETGQTEAEQKDTGQADVMKTYYFYGDSNTYGFDPRGIMGGRYPAYIRWPDVLQGMLNDAGDCAVVMADGLNGREIPSPDDTAAIGNLEANLRASFQADSPVALFAVMLGTNDYLNSYGRNVGLIVDRMEKFCEEAEKCLAESCGEADSRQAESCDEINSSQAASGCEDGSSLAAAVCSCTNPAAPAVTIAIIAPPPIRIPGFSSSGMTALREGFRSLADIHGWTYIDTSDWGLKLAYDGVHLSEEGHQLFAERMKEIIEKMME